MVGEPFFIKKGKTGALLLHGFTSSPNEMKELAEYLAERNITCYCPTLLGHGKDSKRLNLIKSEDWIKSTNNSMKLLKKYCNKIYLIGVSFGGNLALSMADKHKEIIGLIVISTPIRFKKGKIARELINVRMDLLREGARPKTKKEKLYVKKYFDYKNITIRTFTQVSKVVSMSEKNLKNISCPIFIINSDIDALVDEKSVVIIFNNVNSKLRDFYWVPKSYHNVLIDRKKRTVIKKIHRFIEKTNQYSSK